MMHGPEKSDFAIVAGKPANKAEQPAATRLWQKKRPPASGVLSGLLA
jgi:hypothetical protein